MFRALVAGHGAFPDGIVAAVAQITGRAGVLQSVSNSGLDREQIEAAIRGHVARGGVRVVFTDLPGGSATLAARRVGRDHPELTIVTGVNLSTLLDFVFSEAESPADAARDAAARGRDGITALGGA